MAKAKAKPKEKATKAVAKVKKPEKRKAFAGRILDPDTGGYVYPRR